MRAEQFPLDDWLHFASMDHGFNNPTSWGWYAVNKDGMIVKYDEHYESGLIVKEHAEIVHMKEKYHGIIPEYRVGDPSIKNTDPITGTSVHLEYAECGVEIVLGNNDVDAGIQVVARRIGTNEIPPSLYITRNCPMTLWEMARYHWATWANRRDENQKNKKERPHKKDDHAMDELRYACASRPSIEDGAIPENREPEGLNLPIDPYATSGLVDVGVTQRRREKVFDEELGTEW